MATTEIDLTTHAGQTVTLQLSSHNRLDSRFNTYTEVYGIRVRGDLPRVPAAADEHPGAGRRAGGLLAKPGSLAETGADLGAPMPQTSIEEPFAMTWSNQRPQQPSQSAELRHTRPKPCTGKAVAQYQRREWHRRSTTSNGSRQWTPTGPVWIR